MNLKLILGYLSFSIAAFSLYGLAQQLDLQDYDLKLILSRLGTILICLDFGIFLTQTKTLTHLSFKDYFSRQDILVPRIVMWANKLGHLGLMLIICSWVVPMLQ